MNQFYTKFTIFVVMCISIMQLPGINNDDISGLEQDLFSINFITHGSFIYTDTFNVGMPVTQCPAFGKLGQKPFLYGIRKLVGIIADDFGSILHNFNIYHKYLRF